MIEITPFTLMQQLVGTKELSGNADNPLILAMLQCCDSSVSHDEVPWCSAGLNFICKLANAPRSKSLAAKSWLKAGRPIDLSDAIPGWDVVILNRGNNPALGHVGLFAGIDMHNEEANATLVILGCNQSNSISLQHFPIGSVAGVRRLI